MKAPRPVLVLCLLAAACGGGRTTAATQPTPAAFNAAGSDPKAVALVDEMLTALGGAAQWDQVKQLQWEQRYSRDGKLLAIFRHAWDRWNGRHRYERVNMDSVEKAQREGKPDEIVSTVAMYDLFDRSKGTATHDGQRLGTEERDKFVDEAYKSFMSDSYRLTAIFKVKDPGVKLAGKGQVQPIKEFCKPTCDVVEITFDPAVGTDTWFISINSQTKMPDLLEKAMPGGRLSFGLSGWTKVGGLQFPGKIENVGMAESFEIKEVQVGEPQDELYIPTVTD